MTKKEKELLVLSETYATTKRAVVELTKQLKELEAKLKETGAKNINTNDFKITFIENKPKKMFVLETFKQDYPDIDFENEKYYKWTAASVSIKFTDLITKTAKQEEADGDK